MSESMRTALVTGANRGLGVATCRQLGTRGFRVLLTSRSEREGERAVRELTSEGLPVEFRQLDVADEASIATLATALARDGTSIDVLVNNAGISLNGFDAEVAKRTLEVNFYGALRVTDALLPRIPDDGYIVMVSSGLGEVSCLGPRFRSAFLAEGLTRDELIELMRSFVHDVELGQHTKAGWPSSAYSVSKVGLNALVRILARELSPRGIHVNAVCPGWVRTDMGGPNASRSVETGAASIVWAALPGAPTGGFFRDGRSIPW